MKDKLSKKIKVLEREIRDADRTVSELQSTIEYHKAVRAEHQKEINKFTALLGDEDSTIKAALEQLEEVYKTQLVLQGKIDELKDFYDEVIEE